MATRLKVNKTLFLGALDRAIDEIDEGTARLQKESDKWDWHKDAKTAVALVRKAASDPNFTEDMFNSMWQKARIGRPDYERRINGLERRRGDILDLRDLVKLSNEDSFTVSTDDILISSILHILRNRKA